MESGGEWGGVAGIAIGTAMSARMRGTDQVTVCFFGEGALGQGLLYEAMNMASLWKLPVIYVCENNLYNEYTHFSETTVGEIASRPEAFCIHTAEVNGQDVREVYLTARRLVERARKDEGPAFMICNTYRYRGHHVGDVDRSYYRSKEEEEVWKRERDPIELLAEWLISEEMADRDTLDQMQAEGRSQIEAGVQFALNAPYPNTNEVDQYVYA